jgi:predicted ester cyclase
VIDIVCVENGQIVEHWNEVDRIGLMQQLGVLEGAVA